MRIGVFGAVYVNVRIRVDGKFDELGMNEGHAVTSYSSQCVELAKKLSIENEVIFLTSLDTETEIYVLRLLKKYGIDTQYCTCGSHGMGFHIEFEDDDKREATIAGHPDLSGSVEMAKRFEDEIFEKLDIMITDEIDEDFIGLCEKHKVPVFIIAEESDLELMDDADVELLRNTTVVAPDKVMDELSAWLTLPQAKD